MKSLLSVKKIEGDIPFDKSEKLADWGGVGKKDRAWDGFPMWGDSSDQNGPDKTEVGASRDSPLMCGVFASAEKEQLGC